jgi:hypothetical protein
MNPANRSTIIPIQALDVEGTAYDTSQGIIYAAGLLASNGSGGVVSMQAADIANMSFRSLMPSNYQNSVVQIADAIGLLMVAAVGNDAAPIPTFPAWYPQVISVSAIDTTEALASFSNWGKVELTAPGVNVYTTSYDYSGCVQQPPLPCDSASGGAPGYFPATGTSLAAPIVSGIAALYKAHNDWVNNVILRNMLLNNAADWGTPGVDIQFGEGLVQAAPGRGAGLVTDVGPMQAYVVNRDTGEIREDLTIGGTFQFPNLPSGRYYLLAATDEDGDGIYGETAEAVGAGGGGGALQNARTRFWPGGTLAGTINFTPEWPGVEAVGNDVWTGASTTFVGLYAETAHSSAGDIDWFRFKVPFSGTYRLWTEGRNTVECRTVYNEMDPLMSLYEDPTSAAINVDSDSGTGTCAELNVWLDTSKWYYVTIESEDAAQDIGDATILHIDGPV